MTYTPSQLEAMDARTLAATALEVVCGKTPMTAKRDADLLTGWQAMGEVWEALVRQGWIVSLDGNERGAEAEVYDGYADRPVEAKADYGPTALMRAAVLAVQELESAKDG